MNEYVILVDENDKHIGLMPKLEAHQRGAMHRAFSVFIFNNNGELMLQKRADTKYHSGGLWTNTCCSHPRFDKVLEKEAVLRLQEEMGLVCDLKSVFSFHYQAGLDNDLFENEFDHVFFGFTDMLPVINPAEVQDWKYIDLQILATDIQKNPAQYTAWLKVCFDKVLYEFNKLK